MKVTKCNAREVVCAIITHASKQSCNSLNYNGDAQTTAWIQPPNVLHPALTAG